jgi:transcriptional regulator with XRE-family HTH domain
MSLELKKIVRDKINELGVKDAAKYFGVSIGTVSNWSTGKTSPSIDALEQVIEERGGVLQPELPKSTQEEVMWEGRKLHILLPVYRSFDPDTHFTLFANYAKYGPDKIAISMKKRTVIHEARNFLVDKARKTPGTEWVLFIDDDMILPFGSQGVNGLTSGASIPEPAASMNAISRIMSHPKECLIVGGLYFGRHSYGKAQCELGFSSELENANLRRHKYNHLIPMGWIGTGFLKIHVSVFDRMDEEIKKGRWPDIKAANETRWNGYFTPLKVSVGEDVSFGRRAEEIGIKSYLDPVLECLHKGENAFGSSNTTDRQ